MLATARRLATQLEAEVLDETRSTLTRQTARHIRERIIQFELQRRVQHPT
jgi:FtsZ-interacting cell division protein ZipA